MSHDLRQALGYRHIPSRDAEEQHLRDQWYDAKLNAEGKPASDPAAQYFVLLDRKLRDHLWEKACRTVEADRAKHPKAKRNMAVGSMAGKDEKTGKQEIPQIEGFTR